MIGQSLQSSSGLDSVLLTASRHRLPDGTFLQQPRDYYGFELAAYESVTASGDEIKNSDRVTWVRRALWEALQALDRDALRTAAGNHVRSRELGRMVKRRNLLVECIQGLINERGAEAVLFD